MGGSLHDARLGFFGLSRARHRVHGLHGSRARHRVHGLHGARRTCPKYKVSIHVCTHASEHIKLSNTEIVTKDEDEDNQAKRMREKQQMYM